MTTPADVARLAYGLRFVVTTDGELGFAVHHGSRTRGICWSRKERIEPGRHRVATLGVLAVRECGRGGTP